MTPLETLANPLARQLRTARQLANADRHRLADEVFTTATDAFDHLLDGGLARGKMVELVGRRSSGRFSLTLGTLASVTQLGEAATLIDLGDSFDPRAAERAGIELARLLWVRPPTLKDAFASAESVLQSGMPVLIFDLGLPPVPGGRGVEASWRRLARAARNHHAALLVSSPYRMSGTAAEAVVEIRLTERLWQGSGREMRLLTGFETRLELIKGQKRRPGASDQVTLRVYETIPETEVASPKNAQPRKTPNEPQDWSRARRAIA